MMRAHFIFQAKCKYFVSKCRPTADIHLDLFKPIKQEDTGKSFSGNYFCEYVVWDEFFVRSSFKTVEAVYREELKNSKPERYYYYQFLGSLLYKRKNYQKFY